MDSSSVHDGDENHSPSQNNSSPCPVPSKKRKLSMGGSSLTEIQLKVLQLIKEMEAEQQNINEEHESMIKDKNQELEESNKKMKDEILSMKTIKSEIKDSVENERETFQATIDKLKVENEEIKNQNVEINQKYEKSMNDFQMQIQAMKQENEQLKQKLSSKKTVFDKKWKEKKEQMHNRKKKMKAKLNDLLKMNESMDNELKKAKKQCDETALRFSNLHNQHTKLQQSFDFFKTINQLKFDAKNDEKEDLIKKNSHLKNDKQAIQNLADEYKKKFDDLEYKVSHNQLIQFDDICKSDGTLDFSMISCNPKKILQVATIESTDFGLNLLFADGRSLFLSNHLFTTKTCFHLDIQQNLAIFHNCQIFKEILPRIFSCNVKQIYLGEQQLTYNDFKNLVSSENVEICTLDRVVIFDDNVKNYPIHELLKMLPKIKVFKYAFSSRIQYPCFSTIAQDLSSKLEQAFPFLQNFQLINIPYNFPIQYTVGFIIKNRNACYLLKFSPLTQIYERAKVEKKEIKLYKALPYQCNLRIEYDRNCRSDILKHLER